MTLTYKCLKWAEDGSYLQVSQIVGKWALTYKCLILSEYVADLQVSEIVGKWP